MLFGRNQQNTIKQLFLLKINLIKKQIRLGGNKKSRVIGRVNIWLSLIDPRIGSGAKIREAVRYWKFGTYFYRSDCLAS